MRKVSKSDLKKVSAILNVELPEHCEIIVHDLGAEPSQGIGRDVVTGSVDIVHVRSLGATESALSTPDKSPLYREFSSLSERGFKPSAATE